MSATAAINVQLRAFAKHLTDAYKPLLRLNRARELPNWHHVNTAFRACLEGVFTVAIDGVIKACKLSATTDPEQLERLRVFCWPDFGVRGADKAIVNKMRAVFHSLEAVGAVAQLRSAITEWHAGTRTRARAGAGAGTGAGAETA